LIINFLEISGTFFLFSLDGGIHSILKRSLGTAQIFPKRAFLGMMKVSKVLAPDRYLASLSSSVKHHNENKRLYSTIKTSSSSSMIKINIKFKVTIEQKK